MATTSTGKNTVATPATTAKPTPVPTDTTKNTSGLPTGSAGGSMKYDTASGQWVSATPTAPAKAPVNPQGLTAQQMGQFAGAQAASPGLTPAQFTAQPTAQAPTASSAPVPEPTTVPEQIPPGTAYDPARGATYDPTSGSRFIGWGTGQTGATGQEIISLCYDIRQSILQNFGVTLETEVNII